MQRILVINPKGGSGKTTMAINLASYFAATGERPVIMDYDRQGSATHWVKKRGDDVPHIGLIAAYEVNMRVTRSFQLRIPPETGRVIIDTPAALTAQELPELTRRADKILVPVLPSAIDIHACSRCIQNLLLVAKVMRNDNRLGIIANRVRKNTVIYRSLHRFLDTLGIPIVATLRESQNYLNSAEEGVGLHEMRHAASVIDDIAQWDSLLQWLDEPSTFTNYDGQALPNQAELQGRQPVAAMA
ncbi:MAG TPA: ParA family protein [Steroidobacteraceae bacterium]|jgi:chromosome partitioning protein|nr:ParA family protein [Steroidobacteraceae bacterium]